jgi:hypothetical protein
MTTAVGRLELVFSDATFDDDRRTTLTRRVLRKTLHGTLEGEAHGEFLLAVSCSGSAAYVGVDRFRGTLSGRHGSFVLVHDGRRSETGESANITVLERSATDELEGLRGELEITAHPNGHHRYRFDYELATSDHPSPDIR